MDVSLVVDFNFNKPKFLSCNKFKDTSPIDLITQWHTIGNILFTTYNKHITSTELACYAYTFHHMYLCRNKLCCYIYYFPFFGGLDFASYTHTINAPIWRNQIIVHFNMFTSWTSNPKSKICLAHKFIPRSKYDSISLIFQIICLNIVPWVLLHNFQCRLDYQTSTTWFVCANY
jgi:hypothetical protein